MFNRFPFREGGHRWRKRAEPLVQERRGVDASLSVATESITLEGGCTAQTLLERVTHQEVDAGVHAGVTTTDAQCVKVIQCEVNDLRTANEILKLLSAFFAKAELDG